MTQNKVYLVLNPEKDTIEYTIFVPADKDIYVLRRSSDTEWSEHVRNEVVLTISVQRSYSSDNGYKIKWEKSSKSKVIDYNQALELTILLNFINAVDKHPLKYKIIDLEDLTDLM
jgi:hypothetical protein